MLFDTRPWWKFDPNPAASSSPTARTAPVPWKKGPSTCSQCSKVTGTCSSPLSSTPSSRLSSGSVVRAVDGWSAHRQLVDQLQAVLVVPLLADLDERELARQPERGLVVRGDREPQDLHGRVGASPVDQRPQRRAGVAA